MPTRELLDQDRLPAGESSANIRARVIAARRLQEKRQGQLNRPTMPP